MSGGINPRRLGYPDHLHQKAVRMVTEQHLSINKVAARLNLNPKTVANWVKHYNPKAKKPCPWPKYEEPKETEWRSWMD